MPILYLHLGMPKTGTTTLQDFLFHHQAWLRQQGLLYCKTGLNPVLHCHHDLVWSLGLHNQPPPGFGQVDSKTDAIRKLKQELARHAQTDCLLSSELLLFLSDRTRLEEIFELFPNHQPTLVLYLRRQDRWLESLYQQRVKDGEVTGFGEWYRRFKPHMNYYSLLCAYVDLVGREHIIVRVLERDQLYNGDLLADFCHHLGLRSPPSGAAKTLNISELGLSQLETVRLANQGGLKEPHRLYRILAAQNNQSIGADLFELAGPEERKQLLTELAPSNEQVRREFIDRPRQTLFSQEMPDYAGMPVDAEIDPGKLVADLAQLCLQMDKTAQQLFTGVEKILCH